VTLPPSCFFEGEGEGGGMATLWDNSNIVESYSGVNSPLTFSFASYAYETVNLIINIVVYMYMHVL
jgi:pyruvate,water dikinase